MLPIDAVITWVDGQEPCHYAKRKQYSVAQGLSVDDSATRFNACGELEYCLRSLFYFAPWLRVIYLVTDAQRPNFFSWLPSIWRNKIQCVDHRELFYDLEDYLPSFNSIAIETVLWRIPDLSTQFIYFNDDVFLLRSVTPSDFFQAGRVVLRGEWKKCHSASSFYPRHAPDLHHLVQQHAAATVGFTKHYWCLPHVPHALHKNLFAEFFQENPALLLNNISYRFRDSRQYSPVGLLAHLCIKRQQALVDQRLQAVMIHSGLHSDYKIKQRLRRAVVDERVAFLCLQSLDEGSLTRRQALLAWLDHTIPDWNAL